MVEKHDIGVIGLAVMGQNLVLNIESNGYSVTVYNRTCLKTERFIKERARDKDIKPTYSLEKLVSTLKRPRKIILMVKAGAPVDIVINNLIPLLNEGDIIIDGGNSFFVDTDRRYEKLNKKGLLYLGAGISGGEYGALHGPSIMPGGNKEAYQQVEGIFMDIAAQTDDGSCVTYLGPKASGHYVKMVHNGIEYGVMQIIAEAYDLMRRGLDIEPEVIGAIFEKWNQEYQFYLLEITHKILERKDPETGHPLIKCILDRAKQKGTGKWVAQNALELGVPIPTIETSVIARSLSVLKSERQKIGKVFRTLNIIKDKNKFLNCLKDALYLTVVITYAEGIKLLQTATREYNYNLNIAEVVRIWKNGCIIRSSLLKPIQTAYKNNSELINLIISDQFKEEFIKRIAGLRLVIAKAVKTGIPTPAMSSALNYFDSLRSIELPANLIQSQRDYFGAHAYERKDKEGTFHTEWQNIHNVSIN